MADTMQVVHWVLEQSCPFRSGDAGQELGRTSKLLSDLRSIASASQEGRIVDGICVTGWKLSMIKNLECSDFGNRLMIPVSGFRVKERLGRFGGLDVMQNTCKMCPANATKTPNNESAMCYGYLRTHPDSKEVDRAICDASAELGIDLTTSFPATSPIWYGLWIESPLRRRNAAVLRTVLKCAFTEKLAEGTGMGQFLLALEICTKIDIPLHVRLTPLGHTDLGWHSVFPHCPRCKANAPVGRWEKPYPKDEHQCEVCGNIFVPNDTHSQERMKRIGEDDSLEMLFSDSEFESFVRQYLLSQGFSEKQVEEAWQGELERR